MDKEEAIKNYKFAVLNMPRHVSLCSTAEFVDSVLHESSKSISSSAEQHGSDPQNIAGGSSDILNATSRQIFENKKLGTPDTLLSPEVIQHTPITSVDTDGGTILPPIPTYTPSAVTPI